MNNNQNIVLAGFMGTGKTSIGKTLAERLDMEFLDMDDMIVEREGKSISRIFDENGEPYFRSVERELVRELSERPQQIIGTGGGIVLNPDNITDFTKTGLVICLNATPETIFKRLTNDTTRPLLAEGDKIKKITDLLKSRIDLYAAIPIQIDTTNLDIQQVADQICDLYKAD
ncbi:MAG: shikimate kinase [Kiritimatiellae bacterium]|nr:shikimate kinase [Kiritimatiellia bacterium]